MYSYVQYISYISEVHSRIHSFTHVFTFSDTNSFTVSCTCSFTISPTISFTHLLTRSPIYRLIHSPSLSLTDSHPLTLPQAISYWVRRDMMILNSDKYSSETVESLYGIHMKLTIYGFSSRDNTTYQCVAKNSLGETEGDIKLNGQ